MALKVDLERDFGNRQELGGEIWWSLVDVRRQVGYE